jgi:ATP-dependent Clp protease protease subunit
VKSFLYVMIATLFVAGLAAGSFFYHVNYEQEGEQYAVESIAQVCEAPTSVSAPVIQTVVRPSPKKKATPPVNITLTPENSVSLVMDFNDESIAKLSRKLADLDSSYFSNSPIYLFLSTPGGSIQSGLELFQFVDGLKRPVHTITSFAASMGFQAVQNLGARYVLNNGILMSHRAFGGFKGEFGGQLGSQLDSRYGFWLKRIEKLDLHTVKRTKGLQTLQSYQAAYENELWIEGQDAVDAGYADAIANVRCSQSLLDSSEELVINVGMGITVILEIGSCPLFFEILSIQIIMPGKKVIVATNGISQSDIEDRIVREYVEKEIVRVKKMVTGSPNEKVLLLNSK